MSWFYCDRIGTGTENDPYRPTVADYGIPFWVSVEFEQRNKYLVSCEEQPGFAADSTIEPMAKALFVDEFPDEGEDDGQDSEALAIKVVRRAVMENGIGPGEVFDAKGPKKFSELEPGAQGLATAQLAQLGLVHGPITPNLTVNDLLGITLPQIPVRVLPGTVGNSGSFTDDFSGEASNTDLVSHTPSGGTAWTQQSGSANDAVATSGGICATGGAGVYTCDDQGNADQYTQGIVQSTTVSGFIIIRLSDANNWWGVRARSNGQLYKVVAGSFGLQGTGAGISVSDGLRIEGSGNSIEVFKDTGSGYASFIGPVTDSFNNTATLQGLGGSSFVTGSLTDDFEAGALAGNPTASGNLSSQAASASGTAERTVKAQGAVGSQSAAVSGDALRGIIASGTVAAQLASIVAAASREAKASGTPTATAGDVSGNATTAGPVDTGWVIAGAGANDASYGSISWNNPGNITANDGVSSVISSSGGTTNYIKSSSHGFSIPSGATILGIEARIEAGSNLGSSTFDRVRLVKAGTVGTTDRSSGATISSGTSANYDFGGSSDLWGDTWAPSDINASGFGSVFAFSASGFTRADAVWIKVHYTNASPSALGALSAQNASASGSATKTVSASGSPASQASSASGAAVRTLKASGTPAAQDASASGSASATVSHSASGAIESGSSAASGAAERTVKATGVLAGVSASVSGIVSRTAMAVGALLSGAAQIVGRLFGGWQSITGPEEVWTDKDTGSEENWTDRPPGPGETWQ